MDMKVVDTGTPDRETLICSARNMIPKLRERAETVEAERSMSRQTVADLKAAGLFRVLQPERCGGWEMDFHTHLDVVEEIGKGCASTAWCVGVLHIHSWLVGMLSREAQDDIYESNPDALVAAVLSPAGTARFSNGRYVLEGFWPFGSGCEHSDWVILGARVVDENGQEQDESCFAVPITDIAIKDDWQVSGLRGTGSCSLTGRKISVPEHRHISFRRARLGETPGGRIHDGSLYRAPLAPPLSLALCGPAVGLAEGAFRDFLESVPGRVNRHLRGARQLDSPLLHQRVADARARIDTARELLHRAAEDLEQAAGRDGLMTMKDRARIRMDCAYSVRLCREAVEALFLVSGGSALAESNPLQRAWRDVYAICQHATLQFGTNTEIYGRSLLGLDPGTDIL